MRRRLLFMFMISVLFATALFSGSCKKRKLNKQTTTTEDNSLAENMFDDVFKVTNDAAKEEDLDGEGKTAHIDYVFGGCANISVDPPIRDTAGNWNPAFPKTMTIDFGAGCIGNDGKTRKGKIIAVYTGKYRDAGTTITTTTDNYHVNDYRLDGTRTVTNNGKNASGNTYYTIVADGKVTSPDDEVVTWESTRVREWIEGEGTTFWSEGGWSGVLDDVYSVTGSAKGVNRQGRNFNVEITTALRVQFCGWTPEITQGVIEVEPEDLKKRTVDFGNGSCDNEATVKIKKKTYTIQLRK